MMLRLSLALAALACQFVTVTTTRCGLITE